MRSWRYAAVLSLAALLAFGCGIKKEIHEKALKDLADTQTSLQEKEKAFAELDAKEKACESEVAKTKGLVESVSAEYKNLSKDKATLDQQKATLDQEYKETKEQLEKMLRANALRQKAMDELYAKFDGLIKSGKLKVGVNDGRMVIELPSGVLFQVGSATLSKEGKQAVAEVAEVLKTINERKFQVAGHTDDQRDKKAAVNLNWALSYNRARAVFDVLTKSGMNEALLSIAAYAEYSPVGDNATEEGKNANRRIEIVLLPTSDELPLKQIKKLENLKAIAPAK